MAEPRGLTALLSPEAVAERVASLADAIAPRIDDEAMVVCLLTGGLWFAADLMRALAARGRNPLFDAIWLSSYKDGRQSLGRVTTLAPLQRPLAGRAALILDDVIDSGLSLAEAARIAAANGAREILTCVFAAKPWPTARAIAPDFIGWDAPDRFLVGYGMDANGRYRGLAGVWAAD